VLCWCAETIPCAAQDVEWRWGRAGETKKATHAPCRRRALAPVQQLPRQQRSAPMARPRRVALTKGDGFWCNRSAFSMLQGQAAAPCADRQAATASTASFVGWGQTARCVVQDSSISNEANTLCCAFLPLIHARLHAGDPSKAPCCGAAHCSNRAPKDMKRSIVLCFFDVHRFFHPNAHCTGLHGVPSQSPCFPCSPRAGARWRPPGRLTQ
jgi:hypothetical protein